jgi:hypothetical protein
VGVVAWLPLFKTRGRQRYCVCRFRYQIFLPPSFRVHICFILCRYLTLLYLKPQNRGWILPSQLIVLSYIYIRRGIRLKPVTRISALCSAYAQPPWENEWTFNIEDGVAINNSNTRHVKQEME